MNIVDRICSDLRIPSYAAFRRRELELYLEAKGETALLRQIDLGKTRRRCCWAHVDEPHHPLCPDGRKAAA